MSNVWREPKDYLLTTGEVSARLNVKAITLRKWRLSGRGPLFVRCGSRIRYCPKQLEDWINLCTAASTSAPLPAYRTDVVAAEKSQQTSSAKPVGGERGLG